MHRIFAIAVAVLLAMPARADVSIPIVLLQQEHERPPVLSNLDPVPNDETVAGIELGLKDNITTGRFLGHDYDLEIHQVGLGDDPIAAARLALGHSQIVILDAPASVLTSIADLPEAQNALLINATAPDMSLRRGDCRANLLHTMPSLAMRSDALMQFARAKRWDKLSLIQGSYPVDQAFADALRASAAKFGMKIAASKTWAFDADMRRNAAQEVPLFTQELGDYDLLLIADETHDFGRYIAYNTGRPRPVAGSEGLVPAAWGPAVEQWGAAQLQSRFEAATGREMRPRDYAGWAAIRSIGEAVTRTNSAAPKVLRSFILSDQFELAGFKGRALSFRAWNGQMRQPIPLLTDRAMVAQAPLPGYLHQRSELDTLGLDKPESPCTAFD
ncbi:ABC transporter substrate-binding protein [Thalassovita sp.]|uniref:ABC transporter substrate-binding protein n=1 Tax=Thalassovita sp. TaxID=1979401 RepID=UPI002B2763D5|nr:ABC transporter substrate-binding protein [Thalassovita sp.]